MIQLHPDYLMFQTAEGEMIPLPVELVVVEIVGEQVMKTNSEIVRNASIAVLHYFKHDLGRMVVSVAEFTQTLETVLSTLGAEFTVSSECRRAPKPDCDLAQLATGTEDAFELLFFARLRAELHAKLASAPAVLRFCGLRNCVKGLLRVKRWTPRCQSLNDQIVRFLRDCLSVEDQAGKSGLMISQ